LDYDKDFAPETRRSKKKVSLFSTFYEESGIRVKTSRIRNTAPNPKKGAPCSTFDNTQSEQNNEAQHPSSRQVPMYRNFSTNTSQIGRK
jgi:hypothetical protein